MFSNEDGTAATEGRKLVCGPYRSAQFVSEEIYVVESHKPSLLAFHSAEGWRVHDGGGPYRSVSFRPHLLPGEQAQW